MVSEEQARTGKLRQELAAAAGAHAKEMEARERLVEEVSGALRACQVAQREGEAELVRLRAAMQAAEDQLAQQRYVYCLCLVMCAYVACRKQRKCLWERKSGSTAGLCNQLLLVMHEVHARVD